MLQSERPHLYLDTNVILDAVLHRRAGESSREVIKRVEIHRWRCSTSYYALMEMLDVLQEESFIETRREEGLILSEIQRLLGARRQRRTYWIRRQELARLYDRLTATLEGQYSFILLQRPDTVTFWTDAALIGALSNLGAADALHLATAHGALCDVLVTRDDAFQRIVRDDVAESYRMPVVDPSNLDDGLREAGFEIDQTGQATRRVPFA